ncbi:MAG: sigma 54-interacting transcriptional regulator [Clostridia bacterium]|nr:sigma 54-interacting transcriptional regulator [Clostridia bacterium]
MGETFLTYRGAELRVSMDVYRIENFGTTDGYVVICRDVGDIIAMSQQFIGSPTTFQFETIITKNPMMLDIIEQCRQVADQRVPILLEGESGTGKEVFAQSIHNAGRRRNKPFVAVNCAALPINLVESELFGYEKGSFTDGLATGKAGKFELANSGTIFLDEIGELPLDVQAKLLRVLDNYRVTRIGGKTEKKLDIRVIAATNRNLYDLVQAQTFREDLYYRINVMNFTLPPLSQRKEDIPLLIAYFIDQLNMENRGVGKHMSEACVRALSESVWKGNIRELQNAVTRAYYLCGETVITAAHLPKNLSNMRVGSAPARSVGTCVEMEETLMRQAFFQHERNAAKAAAAIGMSRATFYRKMRVYGIVN